MLFIKLQHVLLRFIISMTITTQNTQFDTTTKDAFDIFNSILNNIEQTDNTKNGLNNNDNDNDNEDNTCYISGQSLNHTKTTLPCGHSFNYMPLLNDLINYKRTHLTHYSYKNNFFSCPYCRKHINGTIPYRPDISKITFNQINKPVSASFLKNPCYNKQCKNNATVPLGQVFNNDNNNKNDNDNDNDIEQYYACFRHYKDATKKLNKISSDKHISNVKHKQPKSNVKHITNNVSYISQTNNSHTNSHTNNHDNNNKYCSAILKSGNRKGELCNVKLNDITNNFCKRHKQYENL